MRTREDAMIIDCTQCQAHGLACARCAATALVEPDAELGPAELRALMVLANAGLIQPLRYAPSLLMHR
jgi:hypothetical protein